MLKVLPQSCFIRFCCLLLWQLRQWEVVASAVEWVQTVATCSGRGLPTLRDRRQCMSMTTSRWRCRDRVPRHPCRHLPFRLFPVNPEEWRLMLLLHDYCYRQHQLRLLLLLLLPLLLLLLSAFLCSFIRLFFLLLLAGVQPTLDPSADTWCRSSALVQERRGIGWYMRVYVWHVGYFYNVPPVVVAYCLAKPRLVLMLHQPVNLPHLSASAHVSAVYALTLLIKAPATVTENTVEPSFSCSELFPCSSCMQ